MSVLIASAHIDCPNSRIWRRLQPEFVKANSSDFEYSIVVNGDNPAKYRQHAKILASVEQASHLQCILLILEAFQKSSHSYLLLLDSDCWPVRRDWFNIICSLLEDRLYAAPIRSENFDVFPHPCAFFMSRKALDTVDFGYARIKNLLGQNISDVGAAMPVVQDNSTVWLPLVKTNYISPHPVFASIYGDLFYHHCAGSREIGARAIGSGIYDHIIRRRQHKQIYDRITKQLLKRPKRFINELRGIHSRVANKVVDI